MLAEENLSKGVLYAVAACIVGAVAWGLISVSTGRQIGFMPIAIGFMVGFAMRKGKGIRPIFGIIGAALSLISCVLGDFFSSSSSFSKLSHSSSKAGSSLVRLQTRSLPFTKSRDTQFRQYFSISSDVAIFLRRRA